MPHEEEEQQKLQQNGYAPQIVADLNKNIRKIPLGETKKAVFRQKLMVFLGNTGILGAGMSVSIPSVTLNQLLDSNQTFCLTNEEASWFSSINTMACPLGGILISYLMDRIGRKRSMLLTNFTGVVGWLLLAAAPLQEERAAILAQMLLGRFLSGIMIGLCLSPMGVYSAEISLPRIRGRLILGTSLAIAVGITFMYGLGYFIRSDWQLISSISCVYQFISFLCVLPMPETPSWLMQKGRTEQARKSLQYFRGLSANDALLNTEFEEELLQIKNTAERSRSSRRNESLLQAIRAPEVYKPLVLMISFFALQQFSGVVVIVVYAVQVATAAGVSFDPVLVAVILGIARIITTYFMSGVFEKWGRRPAGLISAAGMTVCMLLLSFCIWFPTLMQFVPLLPAICIVLHIVFSTMGLLTLPFFMISEVFPQRVRGSATGWTVCFGLLISFAVLKFFPSLALAIGMQNVFAMFGGISLSGVFFIYFLIPETRGRTLLEIEEYFRTGRKFSEAEVRARQQSLKNAALGLDVELKLLEKK